MKKLPIGIQTFEEIRTEDYIYIDKTKEAYELITTTKYAFLSRPRRFGKSLFVDTLKCVFEGRKELFEGLYIYDKWDWDDKYPVIKLTFGNVTKTSELLNDIIALLNDNKRRLELTIEQALDYATYFKELIITAHNTYNKKVVILVDEYDKPILDNVDKPEIAKECREILKRLYTEIKNQDEYIRFVFLTGVSKFSKTSIFSGLNMLKDITLDPRYGNICGYTQNDLDTSFAEMLEGVDKEKVKEWYNGYNFLKDKLYNPFDILLFIDNQFTYRNYWFSTGTPTFLVKLLESKNYYLPNFSTLEVGENILESFDIENIEVETILFQSGYLTIDEVITNKRGLRKFRLKVPNFEVQTSLFDNLLLSYFKTSVVDKENNQDDLIDALDEADMDKLHNVLRSIYSDIPYTISDKISKYEGYYSSVLYCYLQSLGYDVIAEDISNIGRMDLTVKIGKLVYIIEFKVKDEDALQQIKTKKYYEKYMQKADDIYIIGINFDVKERNIKEFKYEKIK